MVPILLRRSLGAMTIPQMPLEPWPAAPHRFDWWERQDPATFLDFDRAHPSRAIACAAAIDLASKCDGHHDLLEAGPGSGIDYATTFEAVDGIRIRYTGYEPTRRFLDSLCARFPQTAFINGQIAEIPSQAADVVYARHVLEHQPGLQPALGQLLAAARHAVVITWYRPPADVASCGWADDVPCHTYVRADVLAGVESAGYAVSRIEPVDGNEVWILERLP
jgi:hypothetical protein